MSALCFLFAPKMKTTLHKLSICQQSIAYGIDFPVTMENISFLKMHIILIRYTRVAMVCGNPFRVFGCFSFSNFMWNWYKPTMCVAIHICDSQMQTLTNQIKSAINHYHFFLEGIGNNTFLFNVTAQCLYFR